MFLGPDACPVVIETWRKTTNSCSERPVMFDHAEQHECPGEVACDARCHTELSAGIE